MATLTVYEHQGVVRGQTAKGCRTDEGSTVADGLTRHVVGRHQRLHEVVHVGVGRPVNGFSVEHVHRNGGIRCGPRLTTETGDHHLFDGLFGQRDGRHGEGSACRCNRNRKGQNLKFACLHTFNSQLGRPSSGRGLLGPMIIAVSHRACGPHRYHAQHHNGVVTLV